MTSLPLRDAARLLVGAGATVREAIQRLDATGSGLVLLVDERDCLVAALSDGDVRRAMLREIPLTAQALAIASRTPISAPSGIGRRELLALFREKGVRQIPLLDAENRPAALAVAADVAGAVRSEPVVIMAGGRGARLGSLTAETPKPMIDVGGRPILETIIDQLVADGFATMLLAVNYQAARIQAHFGNGERFGARVEYLCEGEPLGTAGALRLAAERLTSTFLVLNADLLTSASFAELADAHRLRGDDLTLGVSDVDIELRYGVVDIDSDGRVNDVREKPKVKVTANAGMYVVEPSLLPLVPPGPSTMPELVARALERGLHVGSYAMRGLWLDIGELADLQRAHAVYEHLVNGRPT